MTDATTKKHDSFYQPGELGMTLRHYREQAGMEVEQIAEELCLSPSAVVALENENFSILPEPPYVRGYLRSYARLAGMDGKELIGMYESMRRDAARTAAMAEEKARLSAGGAKKPKFSKPIIGNTKGEKEQAKKGGNKKMFVILAGVLLLLLILWMLASGLLRQTENEQEALILGEAESLSLNEAEIDDSALQSTEEDVASTASSALDSNVSFSSVLQSSPDSQAELEKIAQGDAAMLQAEIASETELEVRPSASTEQATAEETQEEKVVVADSGEAAHPDVSVNPADVAAAMRDMTQAQIADAESDASNATASGTEDAQTEATSSSESAETETTTEAASTTTENENTETESTETEAQNSKIRLVFREEVWLTITDKNGERVLRELVKAGTEKILEAEKPLKFSVGNSYGLEIHDGEELFNHTPYIKPSGTSRFTLE